MKQLEAILDNCQSLSNRLLDIKIDYCYKLTDIECMLKEIPGLLNEETSLALAGIEFNIKHLNNLHNKENEIMNSKRPLGSRLKAAETSLKSQLKLAKIISSQVEALYNELTEE